MGPGQERRIQQQMEESARSWMNRGEMPVAQSTLQQDVNDAHAVDSARFSNPPTFVEAQKEAFAHRGVAFEA